MNKIIRNFDLKTAFAAFFIASSIGVTVLASNTPNFTLKINPGTLSLDIVDPTTYTPKSSPAFNIGGENIFASMTSSVATGTLGDDTNGNIYISNPDATNSWTASIASNSASWSSIDSNFPYNSDTASSGKLTIDPSMGSIASGRSGLTLDSSISLGSSSSFSYTISSITIVQANSSAPRIADFLIKDIGLSQTIPAQTQSGDYALDMTLSIIGDGGAPVEFATIPVLNTMYWAQDPSGWYSSNATPTPQAYQPANGTFNMDFSRTITSSVEDGNNYSGFSMTHFEKVLSDDPDAIIKAYYLNPFVDTLQVPIVTGVGSLEIPTYCALVTGHGCPAQPSGYQYRMYYTVENSHGRTVYSRWFYL